MRAVNTKDSTEGYQQEQIACSDGNKLSPAEMEKLALKQQSVNNELKEMITKSQTKKSMLIESEAKAKADQHAEMQKEQPSVSSKVKKAEIL